MKEYRLAAWPDLGHPYRAIAYRRLLSDMSHRHVSLPQLVASSGLRRQDVLNLIELLNARGLIHERRCALPDALFGSLGPLLAWVRSTVRRMVQGD
mgnify:CR=1 FL=1